MATYEVVPIPIRYKASAKSKVKQPSAKPDPIVRPEFEPDNSRCGYQSRGLQSARLIPAMSNLDQWVKLIVAQWIDLSKGHVAQSMVYTIVGE